MTTVPSNSLSRVGWVSFGVVSTLLLTSLNVEVPVNKRDIHDRVCPPATHPNVPSIFKLSAEERLMVLKRRRLGRATSEQPDEKAPTSSSEAWNQTSNYDVVIIGAGPAGYTAGLYAAQSGLSVLVFGSPSGASLSEADSVTNYPGFKKRDTLSDDADGPRLLAKLEQQTDQSGAVLAPPQVVVTSLALGQRPFTVTSLDGSSKQRSDVSAKSIIIASGATERRLGLAGEKELWGRNLHSCVICDGGKYAGKSVMVVGGGNAAIDAATYMAKIGSIVTLVHRRNEFRSTNKYATDSLLHNTNVTILKPYVVEKFIQSVNETKLIGAALQPSNGGGGLVPKKTIAISGAFLMIGSSPATEMLVSTPVRLQTQKHIWLEGRSQATSVRGVFAAGQVADDRYRQAITAAGNGAQAAIDAERWLRDSKN